MCIVDGCENTIITGRGMCRKHYNRWWKHGDPNILKRPRRNINPICSIPDCGNKTLAKGFCTNHYALNRRNGEPVRHKLFVGVYIKDGYRYVMVGKRLYEPEHRLVMEKFLNRKLTPDEHVHHVSGDTLDNSPSNLRLLSKSEHALIHVHNQKRGPNGNYV